MPFNKVLVATDFTPTSQKALDYALAFARRFGAELKLLHVVEPLPMLEIVFPEEVLESEKNKHEKAERELAALLRSVDKDDLDIETIVASGDVDQQILSAINENGLNLLIIGNHRRSFVLDDVPIPALMVAEDSKSPAFDRILLATDLSEESRNGLHRVLDFAQVTHAQLAAVHAVDVGVEGGAEAAVYLTASRTREAREDFEEFQTEASLHHIPLETIIAEGRAEDIILNTAEDRSADFIVITRGALPGSVADEVIRDGRIPVLIIPDAEKADLKWEDEQPAA
jgi:nucleotide-binding universal stress UspA family protein